MKYKILIAVLLVTANANAHAQPGVNGLFYLKPALNFNEALPVGN